MEKREYSRLHVAVDGTLYKDGYDIPIKIDNVSENGIGIQIKTTDIPPGIKFRLKEIFQLVFYDEELDVIKIIRNDVQESVFRVIHTKRSRGYVYIGASLEKDYGNYAKYVIDKKVQRYIARVSFKRVVNM